MLKKRASSAQEKTLGLAERKRSIFIYGFGPIYQEREGSSPNKHLLTESQQPVKNIYFGENFYLVQYLNNLLGCYGDNIYIF